MKQQDIEYYEKGAVPEVRINQDYKCHCGNDLWSQQEKWSYHAPNKHMICKTCGHIVHVLV